MIVIGVDPDSSEHGIAVYKSDILASLHQWALPEIVKYITSDEINGDCYFSIEDVKANRAIYRQHSHRKARPQGEIGRRLGMCQQAQVELERMLESLGVPFVLHRPQKGNWADTQKKPLFEKITGWDKRSNADTRSAAFMGFLAISR